MKAEEVIKLIEDYIDEGEVVSERRVFATTDKKRYWEALRVLRGRDIQHLTAITGTDLGREIEIIYHISCGDGVLLNLRLKVSKRAPKISTVTDIFPGAILYERELMEMLGVKVDEHPDPRRLFLPDDWPEGEYPLRQGWKKEEKK